ncbi:hypothetical protein GE061_011481 [Apolygus lucorum]|uniref:Uncharacterized protein n=1 Tax=Apolygus lucorum TaxID=248454 RepID=A0A8S9XZ17_APOLU|nr:hypothetical protein GE061_011481 [Apolygus lucorum]
MLVHAVLLFVSAVSAHPFAPQNDVERDRRGMTWSNFMPGGGMTLWSSANDDFWAPEPERRLLPPPPSDEFWASEPPKESDSRNHEAPAKGGDEEAKGGEEAVNAAEAPAVRPFDDDRERRPLKPAQRPGKKGYRNHEDDDRRYSGSNASVNAWFPIMFGVLPQDQEAKKTKTRSEDTNKPSGAEDDYSEPPRSITAIANSVNHATRGLANAHTVLYAGEPPAAFRRMARSLFVF